MADSDQPQHQLVHLITAEKRAEGISGTRIALKTKLLGCGITTAGWGGARQRAVPASQHMTQRQCEAVLAAVEFSVAVKAPFNRHWTVHYQAAGVAEVDAVKFIGRLLKLAGDYARRHGAKFAAVWVRENGEGKGGHVHILLHLPARLSLRGRTRRWVRLAGGTCRKRVSYCRSIGGSLRAADTGSERYSLNKAIIGAYVVKGTDPAAGEALALTRSGEGGHIVGKRCGWTQNIGAAARARCPLVWGATKINIAKEYAHTVRLQIASEVG